MGARIGKRIYWPGSGLYCLDPELLDIGDDVRLSQFVYYAQLVDYFS